MNPTRIISTGAFHGPMPAPEPVRQDTSPYRHEDAQALIRRVRVEYIRTPGLGIKEQVARRQLLQCLADPRNQATIDLQEACPLAVRDLPPQLARGLQASRVVLPALERTPAWLGQLANLDEIHVVAPCAPVFDARSLETLKRSCALHIRSSRCETLLLPEGADLHLESVRKQCEVIRTGLDGRAVRHEAHASSLYFKHPDRLDVCFNTLATWANGKEIVCRDLALFWLCLQFDGNTDLLYRISDLSQLASLVPEQIREEYKRLENSDGGEVVDGANFCRFCADLLEGAKLDAPMQGCLVLTPTHVMAMTWQACTGADGAPEFSLRFYEPNITLTHLHYKLSELQGLREGSDTLVANLLDNSGRSLSETCVRFLGVDRESRRAYALARHAPPERLDRILSATSLATWVMMVEGRDTAGMGYLGPRLLEEYGQCHLDFGQALDRLATRLKRDVPQPDGSIESEYTCSTRRLAMDGPEPLRAWSTLLVQLAALGAPYKKDDRKIFVWALRGLEAGMADAYRRESVGLVAAWCDLLAALADTGAIRAPRLLELLIANRKPRNQPDLNFGSLGCAGLTPEMRKLVVPVLNHPVFTRYRFRRMPALRKLRDEAQTTMPGPTPTQTLGLPPAEAPRKGTRPAKTRTQLTTPASPDPSANRRLQA
ncbi:MAG: ShET2 enterotoxin, N-terminal region [Paucimonas sp.]|nr:ShET2 enterotoxin, N-terminal region [Paucimonas sp.]